MPLALIAGLPATGKSSLGAALAEKLSGHVLDKDLTRAAIFEPGQVRYSTDQDEFVFGLLQQSAEWLWQRQPELWIILGGRTFAQKRLRDQVRQWAGGLQQRSATLLCTCPDALAQQRLQVPHPAKNRTWDLWQTLQASFQALDDSEPHFVIDTSQSLSTCRDQALAYLLNNGFK